MSDLHRQWLLGSIHRHAVENPQSPAVIHGDVEVGYAELWGLACVVAQDLRSVDVRPGDIVGVIAERGLPFIAASLGCWLVGAAYLPIDLSSPALRTRAVAADSRMAAVLASPGVPGAGDLGRPVVAIPDLADGRWAQAAMPDADVPPGAAAYVIYTSGTSGTPKGVVVGFESLVNLIRWHLRAYEVVPSDRALHTAGLGFDAAVWELWPYLSAGAAVVCCPDDVRTVAYFVADELVDRRCTLAFLSTAVAEELLSLDLDFPDLRLLLTGGDVLHLAKPAPTAYRLVNHYGPTEATVVTTAYEVPPGADPALPPIGAAIDGVELVLCDEAGCRVPDGTPGELHIGGAGLALGYLRDPALTARRFVSLPDLPGRWYRTGDLAVSRDGTLEFLGRVDAEQLKVHGIRVEAAEIEAALMACVGVRGAAVTMSRQGPDSVLVAVVTGGGELSSALLRKALADRLPSALIPNHIFAVERLPLTANGKIDRRAITALAAEAL